jgi:hypothetical protein
MANSESWLPTLLVDYKDEGSFVFLVESLVDLGKILEVLGIKDDKIFVPADRFV